MSNPTRPDEANYSRTNVASILEQAFQGILYGQLKTRKYPIYISDDNQPKKELPYINVNASQPEELVFGPQGAGAGYFKVVVNITYKGHAKATDAPERQAVVDAINWFGYNNPVEVLNEIENFYCHGFMPTATGGISVDTELKAFVYATMWTVICMPNNNT